MSYHRAGTENGSWREDPALHMGHKMRDLDAIAIAERYVRAAGGHALTCLGATKHPGQPPEWAVLLATTVPGGVMDGPVVVIVDEGTRQPRFLAEGM